MSVKNTQPFKPLMRLGASVPTANLSPIPKPLYEASDPIGSLLRFKESAREYLKYSDAVVQSAAKTAFERATAAHTLAVHLHRPAPRMSEEEETKLAGLVDAALAAHTVLCETVVRSFRDTRYRVVHEADSVAVCEHVFEVMSLLMNASRTKLPLNSSKLASVSSLLLPLPHLRPLRRLLSLHLATWIWILSSHRQLNRLWQSW